MFSRERLQARSSPQMPVSLTVSFSKSTTNASKATLHASLTRNKRMQGSKGVNKSNCLISQRKSISWHSTWPRSRHKTRIFSFQRSVMTNFCINLSKWTGSKRTVSWLAASEHWKKLLISSDRSQSPRTLSTRRLGQHQMSCSLWGKDRYMTMHCCLQLCSELLSMRQWRNSWQSLSKLNWKEMRTAAKTSSRNFQKPEFQEVIRQMLVLLTSLQKKRRKVVAEATMTTMVRAKKIRIPIHRIAIRVMLMTAMLTRMILMSC